MSIRPIDFNGMLQNTNEVSHTKAHEDQAPSIQQSNVVAESIEQSELSTTQVHEPEDASAESELDAEREGNGSGYAGNNGKRKKKAHPKVPDGSVRVKSAHKSFDITI